MDHTNVLITCDVTFGNKMDNLVEHFEEFDHMNLQIIYPDIDMFKQIELAAQLKRYMLNFPVHVDGASEASNLEEQIDAIETEPLTEAVQEAYRSGHAVVQTQPDIVTAIEVPDEVSLKYSAYILPPEESSDQSATNEVFPTTLRRESRTESVQAADLAWACPIDVETRTRRLDSVISGIGSDSTNKFAPNTPTGIAGADLTMFSPYPDTSGLSNNYPVDGRDEDSPTDLPCRRKGSGQRADSLDLRMHLDTSPLPLVLNSLGSYEQDEGNDPGGSSREILTRSHRDVKGGYRGKPATGRVGNDASGARCDESTPRD